MSSSIDVMALRDELDGDEKHKAQLDEEIIARHRHDPEFDPTLP
jgi:hypothetical protein